MADLGLLPGDSVARRLDRESFLLLGGTAALLMQVAHPLVAAGVAGHSDFRRDSLRRLVRTLDLTLATVFGDTRIAGAALQRINRRHGPVRGFARDGRVYDARDPQLGLWVQSTLALTSLRFYEAVAGPLPAADRERYWEEGKALARGFGITELPPTVDDLVAYERAMLATEAIPDATSIEIGRAVLRPFGIPGVLYWPNDALTAGLLPERLRGPFGLPYRRRERIAFEGVVVALRHARRFLPERLTVVPQARRYEAARRTRSTGRVDDAAVSSSARPPR